MKILVVHNRHRSSTASGEDRAVDREGEALADAGHDVRCFERRSDEIASLSLARKMLVPAQAVWSHRSGRELADMLGTFQPDVVHVHNVLPLLSSSVLSSAHRLQVPCVVTFHNYQRLCLNGSLFRSGDDCRLCVGRAFPLPGVRHRCYQRSAMASAPVAVAAAVSRQQWLTIPSAYIFLSEAQRRQLEVLGLPRSRCFVKDNVVPPAPGCGSRENLVAYLGRLVESKGIETLMRAWEAYADGTRPARLRLVIAGSGPLEREVRSWARSRASVDVVGVLDAAECSRLLLRATTVVVPSLWREPFGLVVVEAMAAGVVPIATARGAFEELITHGVNGLLYPPGDAQALASLLRRVQDEPKWASQLGAAARASYDRRFAPSRVIAQLEAVYELAIDHPRWSGTAGLCSTRSDEVLLGPTPSLQAEGLDRPPTAVA